MARQVLPIVGAIVGAYFGNPQLGYAIGAMIGNAVDPQVINGPKLGEGQENKASEGGYRPIVLGKGRVGVCMINQGPLIKRTIRHKQSKGSGPITTEERFYRTMAFAVGEPADVETGVQLLRMWVDGKLAYDVTPTSQIVADSAEFAEKFTFYPGTMDQQPDPDLEAYMGAGNVSAYQGAPYIVFPHYDVTQAGGRAPLIHVELASHSVGDQIYASFQSATYIDKSLDSITWEQTASTGLSGSISVLSAVGNSIAALRAGQGVFSQDGGASWIPMTGLPAGNAPSGVIYSAHSRSWVFGFNANGTICRSVDGVNLTQIAGVPFGTVFGGASSGSVVIFGSHNASIYRSVDGGVTFPQRFDLGFFSTQGARYPIATSIGFVIGLSNGTAFMSSPSGAEGTWVSSSAPSSPSGSLMGVACDAAGEKVVYILDGGDTFVSQNGGRDFVRGPSHPGVSQGSGGTNHLAFHGGRFLLAVDRSIYAIDADEMDSWVTIRTGAAFDYEWIVTTPVRIEAEKVPLSSIVSWLHDRVNVPASKYDVSELVDPVEGVVFSDGYTASDAIKTAGGWYFFDAGEFDAGVGYRIHYVKRGKPAVATLTEQDIVEGPEDWEREDSYERPRVLHVAYQNPLMDYGAPTIPIKRTSPDVLVVGERSLSVPFVHSDQNEVARRGDIAMTVAYTEIAGKYEIVLPVSWLALAPTDNIGFSIRGRTRRLRLASWKYSPDGTIKTEWMADRQSAYTSDLTALPPTPTTPPPPSIVGPTVSAVLDIPALTDSLDSLHLILAASGQTPAWWGAIHQRRLESETDFSTAMVFNPPTTIMGVLSDNVSAASPHYTDTTNIVRVTLYSDDELDTHTQQQFLSENGAFALSWDDSGARRWEVMQYRDAVKIGDQQWELSTLARGRLDTAAAEHPSGSMFVLLDVGVRATPAQVAWIGQDIEHRAVSNGQQPDQAIPYTEEYTGQSQREWPVAHLFGNFDGDDLRLTCVPRHRFGTEDNPVQSINHDGYRWTATDGVNSLSADTAGPSHNFDVTGWSAPITVTVAQLNRITGAGPAVSEVIE